MLAAIAAAPAAVPPSRRTWPSSPVTTSAVMPQVPTYQVLPWTRKGGPALSHSSLSAQACVHWAERSSATCATWGAGAQDAESSAAQSVRILADITGSVGVDDGAGHARRCVERAEYRDRRDLLGRGDAAQRDVGEQGGPTARREIIVGHRRIGEPRRDREAEDAVLRIGAGDGLVHRQHAAFRRGIVPVLRRVATMAGAAGDVDHPPAVAGFEPVAHGEAAQLR